MSHDFPVGRHSLSGFISWGNQKTEATITFEISKMYEIKCEPFEMDNSTARPICNFFRDNLYKDIDLFHFETKPEDSISFTASMALTIQPKGSSVLLNASVWEFSFSKKVKQDCDFIRMSFAPGIPWPTQAPIPLNINGTKNAELISAHGKSNDTNSARVIVQLEKEADSVVSKEDLVGFIESLVALLGFAVGDFFQETTREIVSSNTLYFKSRTLPDLHRSLIPHPVLKNRNIEHFLSVASKKVDSVCNLDLLYLLHWYSSPKLHQENSYLNIFTMLEYIVNSITPEEDKETIAKKEFKKLKKLLKITIKESIKEDDIQNLIIEKIPELQRRSFSSKLKLASERGFISLKGITSEEINNIKKIRNELVHGGDKALDPAQIEIAANLKPIIYELVNRFILSLVGWEGAYYSYRDGRKEIIPKPKEVITKDETSPQGP